MRNGIPVRKLLERVYVEGADATPGVPGDGVPALLKQALPLHDVVKVDLHVPGCPPTAERDPAACSANCSRGASPTSASKVQFG